MWASEWHGWVFMLSQFRVWAAMILFRLQMTGCWFQLLPEPWPHGDKQAIVPYIKNLTVSKDYRAKGTTTNRPQKARVLTASTGRENILEP